MYGHAAQELQSKLDDITKLQTLLAAKGVPFRVPNTALKKILGLSVVLTRPWRSARACALWAVASDTSQRSLQAYQCAMLAVAARLPALLLDTASLDDSAWHSSVALLYRAAWMACASSLTTPTASTDGAQLGSSCAQLMCAITTRLPTVAHKLAPTLPLMLLCPRALREAGVSDALARRQASLLAPLYDALVQQHLTVHGDTRGTAQLLGVPLLPHLLSAHVAARLAPAARTAEALAHATSCAPSCSEPTPNVALPVCPAEYRAAHAAALHWQRYAGQHGEWHPAVWVTAAALRLNIPTGVVQTNMSQWVSAVQSSLRRIPAELWSTGTPCVTVRIGRTTHTLALHPWARTDLNMLSSTEAVRAFMSMLLRACAVLPHPRLQLGDEVQAVAQPHEDGDDGMGPSQGLFGSLRSMFCSSKDAGSAFAASAGSSRQDRSSFLSWLAGSAMAARSKRGHVRLDELQQASTSMFAAEQEPEELSPRDARQLVGDILQLWCTCLQADGVGRSWQQLRAQVRERAHVRAPAGPLAAAVFGAGSVAAGMLQLLARLARGSAEGVLHAANIIRLLSANTPAIRGLWGLLLSAMEGSRVDSAPPGFSAHCKHWIQQATPSAFTMEGRDNALGTACACLALLTTVCAHRFLTIDDVELHTTHTPLPLRELRALIRVLKQVLYQAWSASTRSRQQVGELWPMFEFSAVALLRELNERHQRDSLGTAQLFALPGGSAWFRKTADAAEIVQLLPFALPFDQRVAGFRQLLHTHAMELGTRASASSAVRVNIHRGGSELATAVPTLWRACAAPGARPHARLYVQFTNDLGVAEAGIDAGGLFKEAWTQLSAVLFNPMYGLWRADEQGALHVNSQASSMADLGVLNVADWYRFTGWLVGRAVYAGIVCPAPLSDLLLSQLLGRGVHLHHLYTHDRELYRNLMFVKAYDHVEDLGLTFAVDQAPGDEESSGAAPTAEVELVRGGASIPVTNANKIRYVHLVAQQRMGSAGGEQARAFAAGFHSVISPTWLAAFAEPELAQLIAGPRSGIDVADWQAHTQYKGGYTVVSAPVRYFWTVLAGMTQGELAATLHFITAAPRPPACGFSGLQPPFAIQAVSDTDRLPSASTCFNTLKLPAYGSAAELKEKLLTAVSSGAGFDLS